MFVSGSGGGKTQSYIFNIILSFFKENHLPLALGTSEQARQQKLVFHGTL